MNVQKAITIRQGLQSNDEIIEAALLGIVNKHTYAAYSRWLKEFLGYHEQQGKPAITRSLVSGFLSWLIGNGHNPQSANQALSATKKLVDVLLDHYLIDETTAARIETMKGVKILGRKVGKWLSHRQAENLVNAPSHSTLRGLRDRAILALGIGCGLRRDEITSLRMENIVQVKGRWVLEITGKHNRSRTVGVSPSVKNHIDRWIEAAGIREGILFPRINKLGELESKPIAPNTVYRIAERNCKITGLDVAPHDLRRTFA